MSSLVLVKQLPSKPDLTNIIEESVPAPPPLPPPGSIAPTPVSTLKRSNSIKSTITNYGPDKMQDELNTVLSMLREQKRKDLEIKPTPEVYINQKSNPQEVQMWLQAKEFKPEVCKVFNQRSGYELFDMSKGQLEKIIGEQEGKRLYSQLNIQKSVSGYQTVRSTELRAILAKARKKIENDGVANE